MNMFSTQSKAFLCAMVVTFSPVCASEQENVENAQNSVVWYKKRSNQVVAGLAAATVGLYVFAVYKDKAASPAALFAAFTGLFGTQKDMLQPKNEDEVKNDADSEQNPADVSQQQDETEAKNEINTDVTEQTEDKKTDDVNPEQVNSGVQNPAQPTSASQQLTGAAVEPTNVESQKSVDIWAGFGQNFKTAVENFDPINVM